MQNSTLSSWPVLLFVALTCVPPLALVLLGANPDFNSFREAAWLFAGYFAVAWLLLIGVIVRPSHVTRLLLALVVVIALVTQIPLAVALEKALHSNTSNLAASILTVGLPEELAKALPVVAVALLIRRRSLMPVDFLFLGAVSGLVFGASEVVHYFTQGIGSSNEAATILSYVWRFVTDPISHACWAGLTGYFIGHALTGRHKWYRVGWVGLAMAAALHGLNDWTRVNGHLSWVLVILVSAILFIGYAKAGPAAPAPATASGSRPAFVPKPVTRPPAAGASGDGHQPWWQASSGGAPTPPAGQPPAGQKRPWWDH